VVITDVRMQSANAVAGHLSGQYLPGNEGDLGSPSEQPRPQRCHDGSHTGSDGQTISNDCSACHNLLAVQ
jgi:hypothetical protein